MQLKTIVIWADGDEPDLAMNKGVNVYYSQEDALGWMNNKSESNPAMEYIVYTGCEHKELEAVKTVTTFRFKKRGM